MSFFYWGEMWVNTHDEECNLKIKGNTTMHVGEISFGLGRILHVGSDVAVRVRSLSSLCTSL